MECWFFHNKYNPKRSNEMLTLLIAGRSGDTGVSGKDVDLSMDWRFFKWNNKKLFRLEELALSSPSFSESLNLRDLRDAVSSSAML